MASERTTLLWIALCSCVAASCAATTAQFPLRDPLWRDDDQQPGAAPREYVSPFAWDGANQMVFRPIARAFAVDPADTARNVNAFDEVPDSSWFENRIGRSGMSPSELISGPCGEQVLDVAMPDGSWVIDQGKPNGASPGFRVTIPGVGKFMLKADVQAEPERATGATAIAARLYHAAGYFAPCDSVVYFDPRILRLEPGLQVTDNTGVAKPFDQAALAAVLAKASHRDGLVRMGASRWLPGKPIGPFRYDGVRDDDPNDVIEHEDRRDLRGARLLAAWLNHFDSREQNSMDVFMPVSTKAGTQLGYVRHYILDLGDCFGSDWQVDMLTRRLGHAYYFDFEYLALDFVTFGSVQRPWERAQRDGGIFNYFSARDFDPEAWKGGYPNPAFVRMTEADAAWMARILARFEDQHIAAAVSVGQYDADSSAYLTRTLSARRDRILRRYLTKLSSWADLHTSGRALCGVDLALRSRVAERAHAPSATLLGERGPEPLATHAGAAGELCVTLPAADARAAAPVYRVLEVDTGTSEQPLRAHLYDLGARGLRLVGIERE
jgi:hypothetical protein